MFRFAALVVSLVIANVAAFVPNNIPAKSRLGSSLLKQARALGNNNNNDYDFSWAVDYEIKYVGCNTIMQFNGGGNGNNKNNNNKNGYSLVGSETVVRFSLCPTSETTCSACSGGGEYVIGLQNFIQPWIEAKENYKEYICEQARENCGCDGADDEESCEYTCYTNAGLSYCIQVEEENKDDFDLNKFIECQELKNNNNNNNNNNNGQNNYIYNDDQYNVYYTGPYCGSDGYSIFIGIYGDQYCSSLLENKEKVYYNRNGVELPYSSTSIIERECLSCKDQDKNNNNNNNNNNNQNAEANELCANAYQSAAKCETDMSIAYPDTSGCAYIKNVLPRSSYSGKISSAESSVMYRGAGSAARVFAWLFAISTIVLGAYAFFLYRKINRSKVDLHSTDAAMT